MPNTYRIAQPIRLTFFALLSFLTVFALSAVTQAATRNVPASYSTIQAAVNASSNGDTVLVADGTYSGNGNRDIDFGGKSLTVTSQNGASKTIIDCGGSASSDGSGNHRGFYIHSGEQNTAISGFTVKNGYEAFNSNVPNSDYGNGVFLENTGGGTITVTNCTFTQNTGGEYGGGVYSYNAGSGGTITLTGCTLSNNRSEFNGGAIYTYNVNSGSTITLTNCLLTNNSTYIGNVFNFNDSGGTITLSRCTLSNNTADYNAAGVFNDLNSGGAITLTNCALFGNSDGSGGGGPAGGVSNDVNSGGTATLINCTLTGNTAGASNSGGGIYNENDSGNSSAIKLTNTIVYGNTNGNIASSSGSTSNAIIQYSDIGGGYSGTGNLNTDPKFVNSPSNLHLQSSSPCLGKGTASGAPTITLDGYTRPNPPSIGAYELTPVPVPGAPTNLTATAGIGKVTLSWTAPSGTVTSYSLYRGTTSGGESLYTSGLTTTSYVNSSVTAGTKYFYYVKAVNSSGTGLASNEASATPTAAGPGAPTNLTAIAGVGKVSLSWTAPTGTVTSYTLNRGTSAGGETLYKSGLTSTTFTNAVVTDGTKYYYTVQAVNSNGTSVASNEASATPTGTTGVPAAPTNLTAVAGNTKVTLTWTAPSGTVTSYTLYRGTSVSALTVYKSGITVTNFTNAIVTNGTTYYYAVAAVNSAGTGPKSSTVSATPSASALPGAPTSLAAVASGGKITLYWTAPSGTVTSYSVYRGTTSGGETFYKTAGTATTFVNSLVTAGTKYYYTIHAVNSVGTGPASNEASATP